MAAQAGCNFRSFFLVGGFSLESWSFVARGERGVEVLAPVVAAPSRRVVTQVNGQQSIDINQMNESKGSLGLDRVTQ